MKNTIPPPTFNNKDETTPRKLLSKRQLALSLTVSPRTLDSWIAAKMIPYLRLSGRLIRFDLDRVLVALRRYEVKEVGARK